MEQIDSDVGKKDCDMVGDDLIVVGGSV